VKEVAKVKFNKIEQGNRSVALYWADFQNIIVDLDYNDSAYIDRFDAGLPERTQIQMAMLPVRLTTIVDYANKAIEIDNRLYNIRARHKRETRGTVPVWPSHFTPSQNERKRPRFRTPNQWT
jgi:hypothetical protein